MKPVALPIDELLPEIVAHCRRHPTLVLEAPPGAGKTTRVPRALLESGLLGDQEIIVLQPRRLPTRLAASRVAEEMGEPVGKTVGYQVRFEDVSGPHTRLRFVTEGVLTRRLMSDRTLRNVGMVVLDEFHERHLAADLSLALLRRLQATQRPDLKMLVMSATLEAGPIAAFLDNAPVLKSLGRRFDVSVEYLPAPDTRPLDVQVAAGVKRLFAQDIGGDTLVFLPGAAEIRRAREACADFAQRHQIDIHALHGDLSPKEQDLAVRPSSRRKLILSTNVAETSVTIDGVTAVIDSGLARVATHSPWSGLASLKLSKISKASATQRAGRAGRTRAGHCLRLYTRDDFLGRNEQDAPEIRRLDLAEAVLALHAQGISEPTSFPFFEAPPESALTAAETLLRALGAVGGDGKLTELGERLLRFPLHPRQGRLLIEAESRGVAEEAAVLASLLGERDIRLETRARLGASKASSHATSSPSDLLDMLERFEEARKSEFSSSRLHSLGLDSGATAAVERVRKQLGRMVKNRVGRPARAADVEQALGLCILSGYPDRLARRRRSRSPELVLASGGSATLSENSSVREPEWMVAVDVEERAFGRSNDTVVRLASAVEPEWLLEVFPERLQSTDTLVWNDKSLRVERLTRLSFDNVTVEETRQPAPDSVEAQGVLFQAALSAGLHRWGDLQSLEALRARIAVLKEAFPEASFPSMDEGFFHQVLKKMCAGKRSFTELEELSLKDCLLAQLTQAQTTLLATMLPERVTLPGGRQVPVHYEIGKPPWIESRLQDFFGMAKGPTLCGGRKALVLHLLAPNQRAVQVTTDLSGFWSRHYPTIRKELSRKYPRHSWPEDPLKALPPAPHGRRA